MDAPDQVSRFEIWSRINIFDFIHMFNDLTELYDIKSEQ